MMAVASADICGAKGESLVSLRGPVDCDFFLFCLIHLSPCFSFIAFLSLSLYVILFSLFPYCHHVFSVCGVRISSVGPRKQAREDSSDLRGPAPSRCRVCLHLHPVFLCFPATKCVCIHAECIAVRVCVCLHSPIQPRSTL